MFQYDMETFLLLTTGRWPDQETLDLSHIVKDKVPVADLPVGRSGIRLQEAEKVRTLFMPLEAFDSIVRPITELLELYVKRNGGLGSPNPKSMQTIYMDDIDASVYMQAAYFPNGEDARVEVYSIDQSSFTDSFPYRGLQRVLVEELIKHYKIPEVCLLGFDKQVEGRYRPFDALYEVIGKDFSFGRGTPMGAYGTFMLATLTHQWLTELLQEKVNSHDPCFWQGDDCTLQGRPLYDLYVDTMSSIGCVVNATKTMKSVHAIEYCGFITTPRLNMPMYRPHYRGWKTDEWLTDRCLQAFGQEVIAEWLRQNMPETYQLAYISGILDIQETDPVLNELRTLCWCLTQSEQALPPSDKELVVRASALLAERQRIMHINVCYDLDKSDLPSKRPTAHSSYRIYRMRVREMNALHEALIHGTLPNDYICHRIAQLHDHIINDHADWHGLNQSLMNTGPPDKHEARKRETPANLKPAARAMKVRDRYDKIEGGR
jgi:hypothetical protein